MAQVVYDPENERKPWKPIVRIEMRTPALRKKHAKITLERAKAKRIDADRRLREHVRMLAAEADDARREIIASKLTKVALLIPLSEVERIIIRACTVFKVSRKEIFSDRRNRDIVFARQFVMYWAVRRTSLSLPQIGKKIGGRDHTTVLHGARVYPEKRALKGRSLRKAK